MLVATDCHLGYMEKDEVRRHDSFQAFEEICKIAEEKKVIAPLYCSSTPLQAIIIHEACSVIISTSSEFGL